MLLRNKLSAWRSTSRIRVGAELQHKESLCPSLPAEGAPPHSSGSSQWPSPDQAGRTWVLSPQTPLWGGLSAHDLPVFSQAHRSVDFLSSYLHLCAFSRVFPLVCLHFLAGPGQAPEHWPLTFQGHPAGGGVPQEKGVQSRWRDSGGDAGKGGRETSRSMLRDQAGRLSLLHLEP